jgi:sortase (surface protein transpeptidase)
MRSIESQTLWRAVLALTGVALGAAALLVHVSVGTSRAGDIGSVESSLGGGSRTGSPLTSTTTTLVAEDTVRPAPNPVSRLDQLASTGVGSAPVRLAIEAIGVDAPIEGYGVNQRTGQMDIPRNVRDVGWYQHGPAPGEPGSAVLAAHVDLSSQGRGVFFGLRRLEPGDRIEVTYADGSALEFRVVGRVVYDKDELPLETIFATDGAPVLTLVTCGGGFSDSIQSYDSNVVVYAVPLPPAEVEPS